MNSGAEMRPIKQGEWDADRVRRELPAVPVKSFVSKRSAMGNIVSADTVFARISVASNVFVQTWRDFSWETIAEVLNAKRELMV
jgi:hypothetical protein